LAVLTRNCPHCLTQRVAFTPFGEYKWKPDYNSPQKSITALRCANCSGGYFIECYLHTTTTPSNSHGNIEEEANIKIIKEYPQTEISTCPEHLPENIRNFYMQAEISLQHKSYDASSIMSRKCLEATVKTLDSSGTGNLYSRIEALYTKGLIAETLKDWAHMLRENGNEAAHEEQPVTEEHASELLSFSELLLMYVFTLPGMITAKKPKSA
jgi:HEPN domain-containing protein